MDTPKPSTSPYRAVADPRLWVGVAFTAGFVILLVTAPSVSENESLWGVHLASAVALLGIGIPPAILALTDARRAEAENLRAERAGLDEQRRVCLMAYATSMGCPEPVRTATVVNALVFQSGLMSPAQGVSVLETHGVDPLELAPLIDELCRKRGDTELFRAAQAAQPDGSPEPNVW